MSTRPTNEHYIPTLDGWRAIAIGLVMCAHSSDSLGDLAARFGGELHFSHELGTLGVQIFFALSGFLITTKMLDSEARGGFSPRDFYLRRVFRILPASLTFLGIAGLLSLLGVLHITFGRWIATVGFLANYAPASGSWYLGHFWSLAVEEHFYMLWPLAFIHLRSNRRRLWAVCLAALGIALWRAASFKFGIASSNAATFWGRTDIICDSILLGVAVSLATRIERPRQLLQRALSHAAAPYALVLAIVGIECVPSPHWTVSFALLTVKFALLPLMILSTVWQPRTALSRLLEWAPLRWIGLISYSLYLYQQLFLAWNASAEPALSVVQSAPLNIACALLAGYASYRLVETPMIRLGHRVMKGRASARGGATTAPASHSA